MAYKIYPGVAHIGLVLSIAPIFQGKAPVLADVEDFIRSHRLPPGSGPRAPMSP
jgi:hypothetical protein